MPETKAAEAKCQREGCGLPQSDLIHHKDEVRRREIANGMDDQLSRRCHEFQAPTPDV
jgi:hypothetical protein